MATSTTIHPAYADVPHAQTRGETDGIKAKQRLTQFALTGCVNGAYHTSGGAGLQKALSDVGAVDPEYLAKLAILGRGRGANQEIPPFLTAFLAARNGDLLDSVFHRVIDTGTLLRGFVQILRSGVTGRRSLGSRPKRLVREWLANRTEESLFRASTGVNPSMGDILKMVHPRPMTRTREAFYGYLIGRRVDGEDLPALVRHYEAFQAGDHRELPDVPHHMLTARPLSHGAWLEIARNGSWRTTLKNLHNFHRHGVFQDPGMVRLIAERLQDPARIFTLQAMPFQLLQSTWQAWPMPEAIREALRNAMYIALRNVPTIKGKTAVFVDVSPSMQRPINPSDGMANGVSCADAAALAAAAWMRGGPDTDVTAVSDMLHPEATLDPIGSGALEAAAWKTEQSSPTEFPLGLNWMRETQRQADLVILISYDQAHPSQGDPRGKATLEAWDAFRQDNPNAQLVCLNLAATETPASAVREDILNIGGFSDQVFDLIAAFAAGETHADRLVHAVEQVRL